MTTDQTWKYIIQLFSNWIVEPIKGRWKRTGGYLYRKGALGVAHVFLIESNKDRTKCSHRIFLNE